jgi:hypothetical protein
LPIAFRPVSAWPCGPDQPMRGTVDGQRLGRHLASFGRPSRCPRRRSLAESCRLNQSGRTTPQRGNKSPHPTRMSGLFRRRVVWCWRSCGRVG